MSFIEYNQASKFKRATNLMNRDFPKVNKDFNRLIFVGVLQSELRLAADLVTTLDLGRVEKQNWKRERERERFRPQTTHQPAPVNTWLYYKHKTRLIHVSRETVWWSKIQVLLLVCSPWTYTKQLPISSRKIIQGMDTHKRKKKRKERKKKWMLSPQETMDSRNQIQSTTLIRK